MLCWLRELSFKGRNVSAKRFNNDSIEPEAMTAAQTVRALHASELTSKEVTVLPGVIDPDERGEIGLLFHNGCLEYRQSHRTLLSKTVPCDECQWKTTTTQSRQDY